MPTTSGHTTAIRASRVLGTAVKDNGGNVLGGANYGGLTLNGGTLQYAANSPGNNGPADLTAVGTGGITMAAGGGTIDVTGSNTLSYGGIFQENGGTNGRNQRHQSRGPP